MTVKEMKSYLSQFKDDDIVFIDDWNEGWASPIPLEEDFLSINYKKPERVEVPFKQEEVKIDIDSEIK